ncbi:hypothetical protein BDZ97DRAFT_1923896 [Flammula alnicola]|nr:hypothetical protein BDZ97DRAFT_1923896 [Flammula alnicola]
MALFNLNLNPTYGAYTIGTFLSNILLGATCVQTYMYFRDYDDTLFVKSTVLILLLVDVPPVEILQNLTSSFEALFGVIGLIVVVVHLSYATRIYHISGGKLAIPFFIGIVSFGNLGDSGLFSASGYALVGVLFKNPSLLNLAETPNNLAKAILFSAAIDDILIAATLTYYLNKARTGIMQTDKIVDRLILYAVKNGILTSIVCIASVVVVYHCLFPHRDSEILSKTFNQVFTHPNDYISVAISQVVGNLYSNSWMATLNSRPKHSKLDHISEIGSFPISTFEAAGSGGAPTTSTLVNSSRGDSQRYAAHVVSVAHVHTERITEDLENEKDRTNLV